MAVSVPLGTYGMTSVLPDRAPGAVTANVVGTKSATLVVGYPGRRRRRGYYFPVAAAQAAGKVPSDLSGGLQ